jgi:hypothetical protein
MSRRVKQVLYGIFYLAVLAAIITVIYFLLPKQAPSCFDGIQNEGEQGIDCGGPCAKLCIPSTIQLISLLGTAHVFSPIAGHATFLAQIENANSGFAASSFDYTVTFYGPDESSTVAVVNGTSFAYADETKYLVLPNEVVSAAPSRADIVISNVQWVPAPQMGLVPQFAFTNVMSVAGTNGYATVSGNITDRDISSFQNIVVVAIFKDAAGAPIGASQTELDSLAPSAMENFSISYPLLPNENISGTELHAYAERN